MEDTNKRIKQRKMKLHKNFFMDLRTENIEMSDFDL